MQNHVSTLISCYPYQGKLKVTLNRYILHQHMPYDGAICYGSFFSENVLRTALSLYMEDEDLPLPTLEEVLVCYPNTTAEEV